jgi:hypothetical protein
MHPEINLKSELLVLKITGPVGLEVLNHPQVLALASVDTPQLWHA